MAPTTGTGYAISDKQAAFTDQQWADIYDYELGDEYTTFEASVLAAAWDRTETLILTDNQLSRLFREHGATVADYKAMAHPDIPVNHAGQALAWLGY